MHASAALLATIVLVFSSFFGARSGGVTSSQLCQAVDKCVARLDRGQTCRILPVPKSSLLPPVPAGTFDLQPLRTGVWVYNDGLYRTLLLRAGTRLGVIDIPDSAQSNKPDGSKTRLTDAAEKVMNGTAPDRIDIVYSHAHLDHIGGTVKFVSYMKRMNPTVVIFIWGTKESRDLVNNSVTNRALPPNVIVGQAGRTLDMAENLKVKLEIVGGHTAEDLLIHIPRHMDEAAIIMYVDTVLPGWVPPIQFGLSEDIGRYIKVQRKIVKLDFDVFVPGHFGLGTKEDVLKNVEYTEDVIEAAGVAERSVTNANLDSEDVAKFGDPKAREFGNIWYFFFRVFRPKQIDVCYRIVLEKWGCRLAGVDIILRNHCLTALLYRAIDL